MDHIEELKKQLNQHQLILLHMGEQVEKLTREVLDLRLRQEKLNEILNKKQILDKYWYHE